MHAIPHFKKCCQPGYDSNVSSETIPSPSPALCGWEHDFLPKRQEEHMCKKAPATLRAGFWWLEQSQ